MNKQSKDKIIVISIMSYYARQIFAETKGYEFRKSPLKDCDLNQKIYVYSAKEDKAIIGYMKVSDIIKGNTNQILKQQVMIFVQTDKKLLIIMERIFKDVVL